MCALILQVWYLSIAQNGIKPVIRILKDLLSTSSNQYLEFLRNSFYPYFVHILKCVPHVCLEITGVIPLYWSWQYKMSVINILKDLLSTPSNQYLEFLNNSFWFVLCTYPEVCFICVPWDCRCDTLPLYWLKQYKLHDLAASGQQCNIMLPPILDHDSYI